MCKVLIVNKTEVKPLESPKNKWGKYGNPTEKEIKEDLRGLCNSGVHDDRGEGDKDLLEVRTGRN